MHGRLRFTATLAVVASVTVASAGQAGPPAVADAPVVKRVPIGYDPEPDGAPLRQRIGSVRIDAAGFATEITNAGTKPIVGLTFIALVEQRDATPLFTLEHDFATMAPLSPGASMTLRSEWLSARHLDELLAAHAGGVQMFLAPSRIRFSDGTEWRLSGDPRPGKTSPTTIPRSLVEDEAARRSGEQGCRDELQRAYSEGASAGIRGEPGRSARCTGGRWVETPAPASPR